MIYVNTNKTVKPIRNFWNNIIFHPTDAIEDDWGKRILDAISEDNAVDTVRIYNMLEDIVTKDENGNLCYDYTLNDYRLDYLISKGFDIYLTYAFMPSCMAQDPNVTGVCAKGKTRYKGKLIITTPPKDYADWEEICYQYTVHIVERYGLEQVKKWHLQCWNEPDVKTFFMGNLETNDENAIVRAKEYLKLYRSFASAVKRVSADLQIGNSIACTLSFLDCFLKGVSEENLPIDFVSLHTYGTSPRRIRDDGERFDADAIYRKYAAYKAIIDRYFDKIDIMIDEWGAASGGFRNRDDCPPLMFREGSDYAAYMGKMIHTFLQNDDSLSKMMICLSGQHEMVVDFSGFRNFFTLNFIRKPIYNAYVLLRKLGNRMLDCAWENQDLCALATSDENGKLCVMLAYASAHFDTPLPSVSEQIKLSGVAGKKKVTVWLIDDTHVNPYKLALRKGWGADGYTEEQLKVLREEGMLKPYSIQTVDFDQQDTLDVAFDDNALVLIEIE